VREEEREEKREKRECQQLLSSKLVELLPAGDF